MIASKYAKREATQLFRLCLVKGLMDENRVRQTVNRIASTRPHDYLGILSHFRRLVQLEVARRTAIIESAMPLPTDLQERLRSGLTRVYGPGLATLFSENAALIAGLRIRVGSDVYDGSVRARLATLEESF